MSETEFGWNIFLVPTFFFSFIMTEWKVRQGPGYSLYILGSLRLPASLLGRFEREILFRLKKSF